MAKKLPVDLQSFSLLREDHYIYIDKTDYIARLVSGGRQYFLSRPRRFGKSLFLSTLKAYWEGKRDLFKGLAIEEMTKDDPDAWASYPVFYFDFNRDNYLRDGALENVLDMCLKEGEEIYGCKEKGISLAGRFQNLLVAAKEQTGRRSVVLVDEYDKPLLETMANEELVEHNKAVFKGFFSSLKSYDEYLQFVFITGVTKFSKVSIFSDLNQLNDISLDAEYAAICGISERELTDCLIPEIEAMGQALAMTTDEMSAALRRTYDGYHFSEEAEIGVYNPYSLLNALKKKKLGYYWFETGTPAFLVQRLKETGFDIRRFTNGSIYANEAMLSDYRTDNPDMIPLLYQTGYLTITDYDRKRRRYTLEFPNEEVQYGFLENLAPAYVPEISAGHGCDIFTLDECMEEGQLDRIRDILTALFASMPYPMNGTPFERDFQIAIYLVFKLLGKYVQCEMHTYEGRIDLVVEAAKFIYIFEFKRDKSAEEALRQIENQHYADAYAADDRQIFRIGVNFDSRKRMLTEWIVAS